jgi:hypothetical protein
MILLLLIIGSSIAAFVVWLQFRHDHYDERRIIDIILLAIVSSVIGTQLGWVWQNNATIQDALPHTWVLNSTEISLYAGLLFPIIAVFLFARHVDWPYLVTYDRLALGGLIGGLFFTLSLAGFSNSFALYPLAVQPPIFVPLWVLSLLHLAGVGIWWSLLRKRGIPGELFFLALVSVPRELFLLTGVGGWLIIRYRNLWQNKRQKNN